MLGIPRRHSIVSIIVIVHSARLASKIATATWQVWNRIPDDIRADIIDLALDKTGL